MKRPVYIILTILLIASLLTGCGAKHTSENAAEPENAAIEIGSAAAAQGSTKKQVIEIKMDYHVYNSISELAERADYIVYGKALSKEYEWKSLTVPPRSDNLEVVTVYEISVLDSYTGAAEAGDVITLFVRGGETEDKIYEVHPKFPEIRIDEEYVFFMKKSENDENGGWLLNPGQSLYPADKVPKTKYEGAKLSFQFLEELAKEK